MAGLVEPVTVRSLQHARYGVFPLRPNHRSPRQRLHLQCMKNLCAVYSEDCSVHTNSPQLKTDHFKARVEGSGIAVEGELSFSLLLPVNSPTSKDSGGYFPERNPTKKEIVVCARFSVVVVWYRFQRRIYRSAQEDLRLKTGQNTSRTEKLLKLSRRLDDRRRFFCLSGLSPALKTVMVFSDRPSVFAQKPGVCV